jgi:hypothetical protein
MTKEIHGLDFIGLSDGIFLESLIIIKYLDLDGALAYQVRTTKDLTAVEALGMYYLGVKSLTEIIFNMTNPEEEDGELGNENQAN